MSDGSNERTTCRQGESSRNSSFNSADLDAASYANIIHGTGTNETTTKTTTTTKAETTATATTPTSESVNLNFKSCMAFARHKWRLYLVEPMILILLFAYNLSSTVLKNQIIFQTCTAIFKYSEDECKLLGGKNVSAHTKEIETSVQPYAARIFMTTMIVNCVVPAIFGVFIGAWSDRFGRKPLLVIAFSGYAINYALVATICYANRQTPISPWYYLAAGMPLALMGGGVTYSVATLCFISDVSSPTERPYRMVFYEAAIYIGLMIGSLTSGFVYEAYGAAVVFAISAIAITFALFIILFFVPESLNMKRNFQQSTETIDGRDSGQQEAQTTGTLCNFRLFQEMWITCFKQREFSDRSILWFTIAALLMMAFIVDGCVTVFFLFAREQFHWTVKQFTIYETFSILAPIVGNFLSALFLRKLFRVSVLTLGILSFLSQAACSLAKGFAIRDWHVYLAIVLGSLKSMGNPMCRTIITNLVPANELGKIFSFQGVLQSFVPFVASPFYTLVYSLTLSSFPGFFNVMSAHLYLLCIAFLLVIARKKRNNPERYATVLS